jgi:hypothetical protein
MRRQSPCVGVVAALALLLGLGLPAVPGHAETVAEGVVQIRLYPLEGDTLLYRGERTWRESAGEIWEHTVYATPGGDAVQETDARFAADTLELRSFTLRDARTGREEDITVQDGRVTLRFVAARGEAAKSEDLAWADDMAASVTVTHMIRRQWERLLGGDAVVFDLLVPSRQDTVSFRVRFVAAAEWRGLAVAEFRMEPDSWLIRALVDPMTFIMDNQDDHALLEYRGRSTIPTADGKDQDLRMVFTSDTKAVDR